MAAPLNRALRPQACYFDRVAPSLKVVCTHSGLIIIMYAGKGGGCPHIGQGLWLFTSDTKLWLIWYKILSTRYNWNYSALWIFIDMSDEEAMNVLVKYIF